MSTRIADVIPRDAGSGRLPAEPMLLRAPDFGVDATLINTRVFDLSTAQSAKEIRGMSGNFLWVLDASSLQASLSIKLDHDSGATFDISKGFFLSGIMFNKLIVTNAAQAGATITVLWGKVPNIGFRVVNPSASANAVEVTKPSVINTVGDVTLVSTVTTVILAANATRRMAFISNLSGNASIIRVGDISTGAARGAEVSPGGSIPIEGTEAIYGYNPGANQAVGVTWTED